MSTAGQWLAAGGLLLGVLAWGAVARMRAESERRREEREFLERQEMVPRLLGGAEPELFHRTLEDFKLRSVQIIGESMQLTLGTKNEATRSSRLGVIQQCIADLDEAEWDGYTQRSRELVLTAAAENRDWAMTSSALAAAMKHIRAAERATRQPTREKYYALALQPVERALHLIVLEAARKPLLELARELNAGLTSA